MKQKRKETELSYVLKRITEESSNGRIRVVLVVNSRSSQAKKVEAEAIRPIKRVILGKTGLLNVTFFQYGVMPTDVDDNAEKLAACDGWGYFGDFGWRRNGNNWSKCRFFVW